jgi:hypothetical protein
MNDSAESNLHETPTKVTRVVQKAMDRTIWVICISSFALSLLAFVVWLRSLIEFGIEAHSVSTKDVIHKLLVSIELLMLVPMPAVIGVVVYQVLIRISNLSNPDLHASYRQTSLAKNILAGFLITVTGTTLLDYLIVGDFTWQPFVGGALLMLGLSAFIFVTRDTH